METPMTKSIKEPSPANLRAEARIAAVRKANWPDLPTTVQSQARFLPLLRRGGGQKETV